MDVFLFLIGCGLALLGIVVAVRPLPRFKLGKRSLAIPILVASLGSCVVGVAISPETPTTADQAGAIREARSGKDRRKTLASSDRSITKVEVVGNAVTVRAHITDAWDDKAFVDAAGSTLERVVKRVQAGAREISPETTSLQYYVTVEGQDRLGNETSVGLFNLVFPVQDLKAANLDNLSGADLLGLASMVNVTSPAGRLAVSKWCAAQPTRVGGHPLCRSRS